MIPFAVSLLALPGPMFIAVPTLQSTSDASTFTAEHMAGLWAAEASFGPEVRGPLVLREDGDVWFAEIQGLVATAEVNHDQWSFSLPGERGDYRGRVKGDLLEGFWLQPYDAILGSRFATPTKLTKAGDGSWRGYVEPLPERISLYFELTLTDGVLMARMRNPERNVGVFFNLGRVEVDGRDLLFYSAAQGAENEVLLRGRLAATGDRWSLDMQGGGVTVEFTRRTRNQMTGYFPADESRSEYAYRLPALGDDGWPVAHPSEVGLKLEPLEALVQSILDTRYESRTTPYIQSFQVARSGKLVLDEYFYGFHRDRPRDTRSSCKTLTALLTGIAMDQGAPFTTDSKVLDLFASEDDILHVDERKRALTVEHLLSMRSGFDCDDNVWDTPGNEDRMQSQSDQTDWIRYTLDLPMVRQPGELGVYCTAGINLLGGIIEQATGNDTLGFIDEYYAQPLQIQRYHMNLDPLNRAYMGGGVRLRPRDHMKLGQLLVDQGRWQGEQVLSAGWIERMSAPHASINTPDDYGFGTWRKTLEHGGIEYPVVYASGNGGQFVIAIPSVEIVVLISAGNYMDFTTWISFLDELVPRFVLDAIEK